MYFVDLDSLSNGRGKAVYGGRLEAYSFINITCEKWFDDFTNQLIDSIGKKYYPVYRIADGELRFLFGLRINWKKNTFKSILSYIKYEIFKSPWRTSWGEEYKIEELTKLKDVLKKCITEISYEGKLAIYWNKNGLNAFTEYNRSMQKLFSSISIPLNEKNYIPFHFGQAFVTKNLKTIFNDNNLLFVSGLNDNEFLNLKINMMSYGAKHVVLYKCSSTLALSEDFSKIKFDFIPDIILVAAGIGASKVLTDLKHLNCPIIDIGSYIHVLSGELKSVHGGFFISPKK